MNKKILHQVIDSVSLSLRRQIAVVDKNGEYQYGHLSSYSDQIAHSLDHLLSRDSDYVGVLMEPGFPYVASLLGISKSGRAFVPMDTRSPNLRIAQMIDDVGPGCLILEKDHYEKNLEMVSDIARLSGRSFSLLVIDDRDLFTASAHDRSLSPLAIGGTFVSTFNDPLCKAYVMFTSGTTGRAKGVIGVHQSLSHFIHWEVSQFNIGLEVRTAFLAPVGFDVSLRDIFVPLSVGGTLCIPPAESRDDIQHFTDWLDRQRVNLLHIVPSLFRVLTNYVNDFDIQLEHLSKIFLAGEPLYVDDVRKYRRDGFRTPVMVNLYGPTETTLAKLFYVIPSSLNNDEGVVPLGTPISKTRVLILKDNRLCRIKEEGEIYIKTPFTTLGYLNDPELTSRKFIQNPLHNDFADPVFKTGDLGMYDTDLSVKFCGRIDDMVKIRGNRVELAEVESHLRSACGLDNVGLLLFNEPGSSNQILICFHTSELADVETVKEVLTARLPVYMHPTLFIYVESIPLGANGKLDRVRLRELAGQHLEIQKQTEPGLGEYVLATLNIFRRELHSGVNADSNFFSNGGHSLSALRIIYEVYKETGKEITIKDVYRYPTPRLLGEQVRLKASNTGFESIGHADKADYYPLSNAQRGIWFIDKLEGGSGKYLIFRAFEALGDWMHVQVKAALDVIISRHEVLRTNFIEIDSIPYQQIRNVDSIARYFSYTDLSDEIDPETAARRISDKEAATVMRLDADALLRVNMLKVGESRFIFLFSIHHIISDDFTVDALSREFFETYHKLRSGDKPAEQPEDLQYKDFAFWQTQTTPGRQLSKEYWKQQLDGELPVLRLPRVDRNDSGRVGECVADIEGELYIKIVNLASDRNVSPFIIFLAGTVALFRRYTGQTDMILGTPSTERRHPDLTGMLGPMVNTLPLRFRFAPNANFNDLLESVEDVYFSAQQNSLYSFDNILDDLSLPRHPYKNPLFDVMLVYSNDANLNPLPEGLSFFNEWTPRLGKFDLTVTWKDSPGSIRLAIEYRAGFFEELQVRRMLDHFKSLLHAMICTPSESFALLPYLEKDEILHLTNGEMASSAFPSEESIVSIFDRQAERFEERISLKKNDESLTYSDLKSRSNKLASYLDARFKIAEGELIAIFADRSFDSIVCMLAVLKSGAAYLPINSDYPPERIKFLIDDSGARLLLVPSSDALSRVPGGIEAVVLNDHDLEISQVGDFQPVQISPDSLMYVIYTSGSTGQPKGVRITHRNVVRLFYNDDFPFSFSHNDCWLLFHSLSFDFSVWEVWGALLFGGRLILPDNTTIRDPELLNKLIIDEGVSVLNQTPTAFKELVGTFSGNTPNSLRYVIFGGEALLPAFLRSFHSRYSEIELINMYGITETTVHVTFRRITSEDINHNVSNIGSPLPTLKVILLDENKQLVPDGYVGELAVGGEGLAQGYHNREELTSARFIDNPYGNGRLYLSGDLGWRRQDGNLVYIGRRDSQVKIRGHRVEPGEVEQALASIQSVREYALNVVSGSDGTAELHVYFVSVSSNAGAIRDSISRKLPAYMVPHRIVRVDHLPRNINGKFDPSLLMSAASVESPGKSFSSDLHSRIGDAWRNILGSYPASPTDDFFGSGGDSIKAVRLTNKIKELGHRVSVKDIFQYSSFGSLCSYLDNAAFDGSAHDDGLALSGALRAKVMEHPVLKKNIQDLWEDFYPMTDIQKGMIFHQLKNPLVYHDRFFFQFRDKNFDYQVFKMAFQALVAKHSMLRTSFDLTGLGEPAQIVHKSFDLSDRIRHEDLRKLSTENQKEYILSVADEIQGTGYDVRIPGLFRLCVFSLSDTETGVLWMFHHAILDGWSNASLFTELSHIYFSWVGGNRIELVNLRGSYRNFVEQELTAKRDPIITNFWQEYLTGSPRTPLPYNKELSPDSLRVPVERHRFVIGHEMSERLVEKAKASGVAVDELTFAAFLYLVRMVTGEDDIVVGKVMHGRPEIPDADRILGCFLNTVPFRISLREKTTNNSLVESVKRELRRIQGYQVLSLMEIARVANQPSGSSNPFFDVVYNFVDFHVYDGLHESAKGVSETIVENADRTNALFDFQLTRSPGEIHFGFTFPEHSYSSAQVGAMAGYYIRLIDLISLSNESDVTFSCVMGRDDEALLTSWSGKEFNYAEEHGFLPDLIQEGLQRHYDKQLKWRDQSYSFQDLDALSNRISGNLQAKGVDQKMLVGVLLKRSPTMFAIIVALAKSGITYVPMDLDSPRYRIESTLASCGLKAVIVDADGDFDYSGIEKFVTAELLVPCSASSRVVAKVDGNDTAYVIYTSGSTGVPKGVQIRQSSVRAFLLWATREFNSTPAEVVFASTSYCFDLSVFEFYYPIISGKNIRLLDSGLDISGYLNSERSILINTVPSVVAYLLRAKADLQGVVAINMAGEPIAASVREALDCERIEVRNLYGPSEDTTYSSCYRFRPGQSNTSIGSPIENTKFWILDSEGALLPPGVVGEICISGAGLSSGYINSDSLTKERFVPNRYDQNRLMYRTGDLGRWNDEGMIEFLGRQDAQVKVRGYRIEPGEIETFVERMSGVKDAVAGVVDMGSQKSIYVVVSTDKRYTEQEVCTYLRDYLPGYMIPTLVVFSDIPRNVNGKRDKNSILKLVQEWMQSTHDDVPVVIDRFQAEVIEIWKELLGVKKIRTTDNFFTLGGNSILALLLVERLNKEFDGIFTIGDLFNNGTPEDFSKIIKERKKIQPGSDVFEEILV